MLNTPYMSSVCVVNAEDTAMGPQADEGFSASPAPALCPLTLHKHNVDPSPRSPSHHCLPLPNHSLPF